MIRTSFKPILLRLLYVVIVLMLFSPLYMYFSHDVEKLKSQYPNNINQSDEVPEYILKPQRPKNWASLKEMSTYAKWAILLSEDWGFYQHQGIDLNQMKVAFSEMADGERFRGASTITQQMVKNVFLSQDRTLWRKVHEMILAQKVERVLSKSRILEVYLNCIEFGPGIYGIKQASFHYFRKPPASLNPREAAFLAMLLPSPKRYYISFKKKRLTPFARQRINAILIKMRMAKVLTRDQYELERGLHLVWEKY